MDIPFRVEQSSEPLNRLKCSNCHYPLEALSGAASQVLCPRCNTWLDIDPTCSGSCLACHKTHAKAAAEAKVAEEAPGLSPCVSLLANSKEKSEINSAGVVRKDRWVLPFRQIPSAVASKISLIAQSLFEK